jgi:hypothetical protein
VSVRVGRGFEERTLALEHDVRARRRPVIDGNGSTHEAGRCSERGRCKYEYQENGGNRRSDPDHDSPEVSKWKS